MIIRQRTTHDCSICTIAMATGREYDEVYAAGIARGAFDPEKGCSSEYLILEQLGVPGFSCRRRDWCLSPEFFRAMAWGRRAIMTVPSLNHVGGLHSVYWTGRELMDPCSQKTYERWEQLLPNELILFMEVK